MVLEIEPQDAENTHFFVRIRIGGEQLSDSDWFQYIYDGSNKTRFQCSQNSRNFLLYIRAIQGHTGGNLIAPELMGHVAMEKILFHRGCSCDVTSMLKSGLIAGGREAKKEDRPSSPHSGTIHMMKNLAMTFPSRVMKYTILQVETCQDAVYWIK